MNYRKSFQTIDTQVVGEAFRIVIQSPIAIFQQNIVEAAEALNMQFENTKNLLLNEPRGHRGIHGCIVLPSAIASFRLLFFQHTASTDFKYEALIATTTALLEQGTIEVSEDGYYSIETVKGLYHIQAQLSEKKDEVLSVKLTVEPALIQDEMVVVNQERRYVVIEKPQEIKSLILDELAAISTWGIQQSKQHEQADGVIVYEKGTNHVCSVTFERDGYILRSPGIDSTLALAAILSNEAIQKNESIFGSSIDIVRNQEDGYDISLTGYITGIHQFIVDGEDPLQEGFLIV